MHPREVLLDPLADHILSPADSRLVAGGSLVALDCSWKKIEDSVRMIKRTTRLESRILPILLAGNPVSWGKRGIEHGRGPSCLSVYRRSQKKRLLRF